MLPNLYAQLLYQPTQAYTLGGGPYTFDFPRETLISRADIFVEGVFSAAAATANTEGLASLVQNVSMRGSLGSEGTVQPIQGVTGPDLFELSQFCKGALPYTVGALTGAAKFRVTIPLHFASNFFDSGRNMLTALPAYKMSDLTLNVTGATQAQCDVNVSPTLAITSAIIGLEVYGFYRNTVPEGMQFVRSEIGQLQDDSITTSATREVKLPSGGDYTLLLLRAFNAANTRQLETASAPFTQPPAVPMTLFDLNRFPKETTSFLQLRSKNLEQTLDDSLKDGNACFVFNRGATSVFQTGQQGVATNNVVLQYDATANTGAYVRCVWRRIFDPANLMQITR